MFDGLLFALLAGVAAIIYGIISTFRILSMPQGTDEMKRIALAIQEGAAAYLKRQYMTIGLVGVILALVILFALDIETALGFVIGAVFSGLAGFIGMNISVRSNSRTAEAARGGVNAGLKVAFQGGAITGLLVVGLGIIGVAGYYAILEFAGAHNSLHALVGLAFGGSLISIFARPTSACKECCAPANSRMA